MVALGEVATFIRGVTFKPADVLQEPTSSAVGVMRTKNVQNVLDLSDIAYISRDLVRREQQYLRRGDLLISSANSWNLVGRCCWVPELDLPAVIGGFVTGLRVASTEVDPRYLYYWFSSERTQAVVRNAANQTTNIANLNLKRCGMLPLPLPPLDQQRRIAAILDHADALRAKRRQVIDRVDRLAQSIFLDMFGDPGAYVESGNTVRFGEIAELQGGRNLVADDGQADSKYRVLKISAVTSGRFKPTESKPLPIDYQPPDVHLVRCNDLLISRANTAELVGAVAYVDSPVRNLVLPDKIWRFVWREPDSVPLFYRSLFLTASVRRRISQLASGTGGSMKNISKANLERLLLPAVEVPRQLEFASRIAAIPSVDQDHFDALFASLQSRAFRGEL